MVVPAIVLLLIAALIPLSHALVPTWQFVHRGDDAFYYFQVALNYAELGEWSFDKIHRTNGVQPLWAALLSAAAQILSGLGIEDKAQLARIFVGLTALANVGGAFVLFHIVRRSISTGTALAAAGAFLVPLGIVWQRSWGMENSLYALLLLSTVGYYHLKFLPRPGAGAALLLGGLLGLVVLARLNAGIFVPILLAHFLFFTRVQPPSTRFWLAVLAGLAATAVVLPYLLYNLGTTDHLLPVSAAAKKVYAQYLTSTRSPATPLEVSFWQENGWRNLRHLTWFGTSRMLDGMWILGSRIVFGGNSAAPVEYFFAILGALIVLPALLRGRSVGWFSFLWARLRLLGAFWYVLVFGVANFTISIVLYPHQLGYAITRWWWVEIEVILSVSAATLSVAVLAYVAQGLPARIMRGNVIATALVALLILYQGVSHISHYWFQERRVYDWNRSGNDAWFDAAQWLSANVESTAVVGAWNAGVLAYYSDQRVVNLDGLINNFDYLEYMRDGRIEDYVEKTGITYIADMESMFEIFDLPARLKFEPVYEEFSQFYGMHFMIYKVVR